MTTVEIGDLMTTEPRPIQERIARALDPYAWEKRDEWSSADHPNYPLLNNLVAVSMQQAAAVLPLIAAEVRKAQADALRETADWWAANPDDEAFETPGDTRNWMRDTATEYETED